jgi:hypothetical protein
MFLLDGKSARKERQILKKISRQMKLERILNKDKK